MSTRCVITVTDEDESFSVYRHSDGYPDTEHGVLADLENVPNLAWQLPRFEASDFAAAVIATWKNGGGNIYMTTGAAAHDDIEYHYEITQNNTDKKFLDVCVRQPMHNKVTYDIIGWTVGVVHHLPATGPLGTIALAAGRKKHAA